MRTGLTVLSLSVVGVLLGPAPAQAQISKLIKKKIGGAVTGSDKPTGEPQGLVFSARVVRLTETVLKGFMKGQQMEVAQLTEFSELLATFPMIEEYDGCNKGVPLSPEAQKIAMQIASLPANATSEQTQRVADKVTADMDALVAKKCGGSIAEEWPDAKRQARVGEIHESAAGAAGLLLILDSQGRPVGPSDDAGPSFGFAGFAPDAAAKGRDDRAQNKKSTAPYDIVQERISAWCAMKDITGFEPGPGDVVEFSADKITPEASPKFKWHFEPDEWKLLEVLGCPKLIMTSGPIIILMDEIKIRGKSPIKTHR